MNELTIKDLEYLKGVLMGIKVYKRLGIRGQSILDKLRVLTGEKKE